MEKGDGIIECLKRFNVLDKKDAIYIGDSQNDIIAANKAEIDYFCVRRNLETKIECEAWDSLTYLSIPHAALPNSYHGHTLRLALSGGLLQGYTKHYYAGTEHIASKIGGGGISTINNHSLVADEEMVNNKHDLWQEPYNKLWTDCMGMVHAPCSTYLYYAMGNPNVTSEEPLLYFYHPDHLGSAAWVTDYDTHKSTKLCSFCYPHKSKIHQLPNCRNVAVLG